MEHDVGTARRGRFEHRAREPFDRTPIVEADRRGGRLQGRFDRPTQPVGIFHQACTTHRRRRTCGPSEAQEAPPRALEPARVGIGTEKEQVGDRDQFSPTPVTVAGSQAESGSLPRPRPTIVEGQVDRRSEDQVDVRSQGRDRPRPVVTGQRSAGRDQTDRSLPSECELPSCPGSCRRVDVQGRIPGDTDTGRASTRATRLGARPGDRDPADPGRAAARETLTPVGYEENA